MDFLAYPSDMINVLTTMGVVKHSWSNLFVHAVFMRPCNGRYDMIWPDMSLSTPNTHGNPDQPWSNKS